MSGTAPPQTHVLVLGHALVEPASRARWQLLCRRHPVRVTILVPALWRSGWFGEQTEWRPEPVLGDRFAVLPLPVTDCRRWGRYMFRGIFTCVRAVAPDVIFTYGEEFSVLLQQTITARHWGAPHAALGFFTWNNIAIFGGARKLLKRLLWRRVRRKTDFALAGNREGARLLAEAGYPGRIVVQPEIGVDTDRYRPDANRRAATRKRLELDNTVVGYVGRLNEAKGVRDLIDALAGKPGCTLLVVGDGPQRDELVRHTAQAGIPSRFPGRQPPDAIPDLLRAMDCLVLPSRTTPTWKEQFGLVLAEAMACGTAVLGSDSGAIPEVIGDAGIVFPEGDVAALSEGLSRIAGSQVLRKRLGAAGRERCERCFSAKALADQTAELIDTLRG